jgi:hypothetical protein
MCDRNLAGKVSRKGGEGLGSEDAAAGEGWAQPAIGKLGRRAHAIGPARKARTSSVLFRAKFGDGPRTSGAPFSEERAEEFTAAASLAGSGRQHGQGTEA